MRKRTKNLQLIPTPNRGATSSSGGTGPGLTPHNIRILTEDANAVVTDEDGNPVITQ